MAKPKCTIKEPHPIGKCVKYTPYVGASKR